MYLLHERKYSNTMKTTLGTVLFAYQSIEIQTAFLHIKMAPVVLTAMQLLVVDIPECQYIMRCLQLIFSDQTHVHNTRHLYRN